MSVTAWVTPLLSAGLGTGVAGLFLVGVQRSKLRADANLTEAKAAVELHGGGTTEVLEAVQRSATRALQLLDESQGALRITRKENAELWKIRDALDRHCTQLEALLDEHKISRPPRPVDTTFPAA